ncbi:MAG TPA: DUF4369 domain-containing protein [Flavobacteriaceae bacterium]|nr:DUF4369 domain-containing protein [Flavobacteriaceae bacterium]
MKKTLFYFTIISLLIACNPSKKSNMKVQGKIDGLKKGTVYLKKYIDTLLYTVDSTTLNGVNEFILYDHVNSPEIYLLTLDNNTEKSIMFFGEPGEIKIQTKLEKYNTSAKITGSKNHELWEGYKHIISQFNGQQLDLIKAKFEAQKDNDAAALAKVMEDEKRLIRRKYLYTTNYAITNGKYEVAPYLAITELYYANLKLLDTVNNSLSQEIKNSKYGIQLQRFIDQINVVE